MGTGKMVIFTKMAEPIKMLFWGLTRVSPRNYVLYGGAYGCHLVNMTEQSLWQQYRLCSNLFSLLYA